MTLDLAASGRQPGHSSEQATAAEMKFAGHYLNLVGMFLLVLGVVSNLKSAGTSDGVLETALGVALGLVLLGAGEYSVHRGEGRYSHPLLTGGFCLLFLTVCSAHFRHGLISLEALFGWLLLVVIGSNASVFRHNSKLIGNVMLTIYFLAPIFMTFSFLNFSTIFLYLLAINLGATVVAFHKRWEFQLTISALGSYAFYFAHFRTGEPAQSLTFLLAVYGLSLVVNYLLYFLQPESGDSTLLLSLVSQVIFIVLSAVVVMGLPNWCRVTVYVLLAIGQGAVAYLADKRRKQHENFVTLATGSSIISMLFVAVSISFVTYFSDSTTFFGLVTFLWFAFALGTLELGLRVPRHRRVMGRFSYFGLILGGAQVLYVLPSMVGSELLQLGGLGLYWVYFTSLYCRRNKLAGSELQVLGGTAVAGILLTVNAVLHLLSPEQAVVAFAGLAVVFLMVKLQLNEKLLLLIPHVMGGAAVWASLFIPGDLLSAGMLLASCLCLGGALEFSLRHESGYRYAWFWVGLLFLRFAAVSFEYSVAAGLVALAAAHLTGKLFSLKLTQGKYLSQTMELSSVAIAGIVVLWRAPSIPALLVVVLTLFLSHYLQFRLDGLSADLDVLIWLGLVVNLLIVSYQPYPMACLTLLAAGSVLLAYSERVEVSLALQTLTVIGVVLLPLERSLALDLLLTGVFLLVAFQRIHEAGSSSEMQYSGCGFLLVVCKWTVMLDPGPISTVLWACLAFGMLYYATTHEELGAWNECNGGVFDLSRWMYFMAFVKSVLYDTNFVEQLAPVQYPCTFLVSGVFLATGHLLVQKREVRNFFLVLGLVVCSFQVTFLFHSWWGDQLLFQPVLSGFWAVVALFVVAAGISLNLKVYRLFGLIMLVANSVKILVVDIHVLDSYSRTNTYLILGVLLMATSFLYQRRREVLRPAV